jgi:hypothetical protein
VGSGEDVDRRLELVPGLAPPVHDAAEAEEPSRERMSQAVRDAPVEMRRPPTEPRAHRTRLVGRPVVEKRGRGASVAVDIERVAVDAELEQ